MQGLGWIVPPLLKAYDPVGPSDPHVSPTSESERETGATVGYCVISCLETYTNVTVLWLTALLGVKKGRNDHSTY